MRVQADRDVCIQAGNCVMVAGEVFDQDDDGIVTVLVDSDGGAVQTAEVPGDQLAVVEEAVKLCPSQALRLVE
ncbi:ferredoxin [Mycolicibacterium elephantis]|uniref:ferredoxin n=1 Tax=Mycolicibacterium elephantis TaxID=81858 RepID=UPI000FE1B68F|nr:ferredoxin [Mycolicibacterium elephantis]MCV7219463.1 ferredoxin [Mycolicibacterium elephantis]